MNQDNALEMFVRFNSGGKPLKKSDITMSILVVYWPDAKNQFSNFLTGDLQNFSNEFIIRAAFMIYGDVLKSTITRKIADSLKDNWDKLTRAIYTTMDFLKDNNIDPKRFSSSWNVLLPIIYVIYYNSNEWETEKNAMLAYLYRAIFFGYFNFGTTNKLNQMKSEINNNYYLITIDLLDNMNDLKVTDARIEDLMFKEKGSRIAGEILYYLSKDWIDPKEHYEQDHLHPISRFDEGHPLGVEPDTWIRWRQMADRIPNLEYYHGIANASKSDMELYFYVSQMNPTQREEYQKEALIPYNIANRDEIEKLKLTNFENFYEDRAKLIIERIKKLVNGN
jgi:hypothetical protein